MGFALPKLQEGTDLGPNSTDRTMVGDSIQSSQRSAMKEGASKNTFISKQDETHKPATEVKRESVKPVAKKKKKGQRQ